ncbi:thioredoxin family protein [Flavobacterium agricola]|uniref:Thioredoxin family protein n=1 Tax=Flavobacterium agricola TaxID=2870839 RepID=A0ABY6M2F8_9FLAO|nr:thioredoxin family protein [Flavobacterium agricola]UYW01920.1 thioredoxin family protein [Flavobacterium agricola]
MTENEYIAYFKTIVDTPDTDQKAPYDNPEYLNYTKLNNSRMNRWLKTAELLPELKATVQKITQPQHWILITEPWCGDAAHNVPFIILAARENPLIQLSFEMRDAAPHRIEQYLTNGGKSIPKLIIKDAAGTDLAVWGPRPAACQAVYSELKAANASFDETVTAIQNWYNADKGLATQTELLATLKQTL